MVRNGLEYDLQLNTEREQPQDEEGTKLEESAKQKPDDDLAEVDRDTFVKLRSSPRGASRRRRFVDTTPSAQTQRDGKDGGPIPIDC